MVVFGTSIRSLQKMGWRQIDILADEVIRRSPAWRCTIIGGVWEKDCDALFATAILRREKPKPDAAIGYLAPSSLFTSFWLV